MCRYFLVMFGWWGIRGQDTDASADGKCNPTQPNDASIYGDIGSVRRDGIRQFPRGCTSRAGIIPKIPPRRRNTNSEELGGQDGRYQFQSRTLPTTVPIVAYIVVGSVSEGIWTGIMQYLHSTCWNPLPTIRNGSDEHEHTNSSLILTRDGRRQYRERTRPLQMIRVAPLRAHISVGSMASGGVWAGICASDSHPYLFCSVRS